MRHECIILANDPSAFVELCGISVLERLLRTLQRCDLKRALILSASPERFAERLASPSPHRARVGVDFSRRANGEVTVEDILAVWPNDTSAVLVIPADVVFDPRLLQLLDVQDSTTVLIDSARSGKPPALAAPAPESDRCSLPGAALLSRDWMSIQTGLFEKALHESIAERQIAVADIGAQSWYLASMRRDSRPYWFPAPPPSQRRGAERVLLNAARKGALDFPAMVHAPIEDFLISHLCRTSITPNQLTGITNIVAWGATFLFATGHLGWGAIFALVVGLLDGLDGKQARVKIETSKFGKLEHWFDALFENSWWIAIAYSFHSSGRFAGAFAYLALLIGAEAVAGLAKWSVIRRCGRTIDELGEFNRVIRLIGGRRNIYVWIFALGVLLGTPVQAFKIIAWWGAVTAAVQVPRAAFAVWDHRKEMARRKPHAVA